MYEVPQGLNQPLGDAGDGPSQGGSDAGAAAQGGSGSASGSGGVGGTGATAGANAQAGTSGAGGSSAQGGSGGDTSSGGADDPPANGGEGGAPVADDCPDDPDKVEPGECGCGVPEVATAKLADCHGLKTALRHRYDFEGTGTQVVDRVGTAHGVIARGATLSKLDGKGVVLLGGGDAGAYVDLPNGLVSSQKDASFEAWVTWGGGDIWQRLFDFGDSTSVPPENNPSSGKSYLFVTPQSGYGGLLAGYSVNGNANELSVKATSPLALSLSQVVVVANDTGNTLVVYVNGVQVGSAAWTGALANLNDVNVWLGRSQYNGDPELTAVYHDFRVYGAALTAAQVASSYVAGPDPVFLAP